MVGRFTPQEVQSTLKVEVSTQVEELSMLLVVI
jgi:hypothetical protein